MLQKVRLLFWKNIVSNKTIGYQWQSSNKYVFGSLRPVIV